MVRTVKDLCLNIEYNTEFLTCLHVTNKTGKAVIISWEDICLLFFFFFPILQAVNNSSEFNWLGAFQVG